MARAAACPARGATQGPAGSRPVLRRVRQDRVRDAAGRLRMLPAARSKTSHGRRAGCAPRPPEDLLRKNRFADGWLRQRIRTPDPRVISSVLYPVELVANGFLCPAFRPRLWNARHRFQSKEGAGTAGAGTGSAYVLKAVRPEKPGERNISRSPRKQKGLPGRSPRKA
jgi:hypothetical protein